MSADVKRNELVAPWQKAGVKLDQADDECNKAFHAYCISKQELKEYDHAKAKGE